LPVLNRGRTGSRPKFAAEGAGRSTIRLAARVHAMTSDRPYRQGMGLERALAEFRMGSGSQWNPRIVAAL